MKKIFFFVAFITPGIMGFAKDHNGRTAGEPVVKTITLPGRLSLQYVEQGDAGAVPVIFLHGFADSWHSYETVLPHLPRSIHAYIITQRGHGDSDRPSNGYDMRDLSDDVAAFMNELKIVPAVIVGQSMGAFVVQRFAIDHPDLVKAIVLVNGFSSFAGNELIKEVSGTINMLSDPVDSVFAREFQKSMLAQPVPAAHFNILVNETLKIPAWVWKAVWDGICRADYTQELKKVRKPSLIIWGKKDVVSPRKGQDILRNALRGSKFIVYENAGHCVQWEEPKRFAEDIHSFVQQLK